MYERPRRKRTADGLTDRRALCYNKSVFMEGGFAVCNIAGYAGERRAAPILIEMIRRQESLNGGHYTGIATIHEGKLYYAKLVGDLDRLLEKTGAADLPGTVGVIHSRTPGKEGDEWAHPFIGGASLYRRPQRRGALRLRDQRRRGIFLLV